MAARNRLLAGLVWTAAAAAHDPITTKLTWSREVSRLVHKRCAPCHHDGGPAPMSLVNYAEARPWAKALKEEVLERRMPPWYAVKGFGDFSEDGGLTQEEMHVLSDWVEGGAPEGDPAYLQEVPRSWRAPKLGAARGLAVSGNYTAAKGLRLTAVRPDGLEKGGSLVAVATLPDGAVEPLLWIFNYQPKFPRTYWFQAPVALPAGTKVTVEGKGKLVLVTAAPSPGR